ncbi:hypothetical protein ACW7EJ_19750, partial [Acinetobacter soli]
EDWIQCELGSDPGLRLAYVAEIYESIPTESPEKFLTELFYMEIRLSEEAKAQRLIKKAKFINNKSLRARILGRTPPHDLCDKLIYRVR